MSDVTLEILNKRANIAAARQEAARVGADADRLLDSSAFYSQVTSLDPDAPGYHAQVRDLVASAAGQKQVPPAQAPTAPPAPSGPRQWTLADVEKSTPAECAEAMKAGLLTDLGYAVKKSRR